MSCNKLAVIVGLVGVLPIAGETQAAQEQMGHWTLVTDSRGGIVSMSYSNPRAAMDLVQVLEIGVQANTTATQGHLTFKDGVKRDMTKEEVAFYYTSLDRTQGNVGLLNCQGSGYQVCSRHRCPAGESCRQLHPGDIPGWRQLLRKVGL